jgi:hypothetical protein
MTAERPIDVIIEEATVTNFEVSPDDHGTITQNGDTYTAEAAVELEILEDDRTRTTVKLGDAELSLTYDREDEESAERAAVLLASAGSIITQAEEAFDSLPENQDGDPSADSEGWAAAEAAGA